MRRIPQCSICGVKIVVPLSEVSGATDWLCLDCSGATLEDFMDEEEYSQNRAEEMRTFHGKSQWD